MQPDMYHERQGMWGENSQSMRQAWVGIPANCLNFLTLICKLALSSNTNLIELLLGVNKIMLGTRCYITLSQ